VRIICILVTTILAAARALTGQVRHELGMQVTATTGRPAALVAGLAWAWRPGYRDRLVLHSGLGVAEHRLAARSEVVWHFLLQPAAPSGVGVYGGAGLAGQVARSARGWIVVLVGIESRPGGRSGWMLEAGVGGGVRVGAGYRWRK
jgi:hypothetical protein